MFIGIGTTIPEITNLPGQTGGAIPLDIFYLSNAFCSNASDPTPTVIGNKGAGTFSSTNGIVFADSGSNTNSSTGVIDISASTAGATYTITYTDIDAATDTFVLTLNALDDATFAYSDTLYFQSTATPTPTVNLPGGTFTAGAGLVFLNSSTGQISLDQSTVGNYTITYTTSGVCPNTSTQPIEIRALAQVNNVYSMEFDGASDYINTNGTVASNLDFSVSTWIKPSLYNIPILGTRGLATASTSNGFTMNINSSGNLFGRIFTETSNIIQVQTGSIISLNNWSHVAMTYDSSTKTLKTYLNGSEAGSIVGTDSSVASTSDLDIGRSAVGIVYNYFNGKIDEVGIFNTALTGEQVLAIYEQTETGKTANLDNLTTPPVAWYRMGD